MAMDGLPEGVPPPGRVPGQLLQAAPILKRRWRRYRGEFARKRSILGVSIPRGKYRRRGGIEGAHRAVRRVPGAARVGPRHLPSWLHVGGPLPILVIPEASVALIFY